MPATAASAARATAQDARNARTNPPSAARIGSNAVRANTPDGPAPYSSVASSVMVAFSTFETGQFAFALSVSFVNSSLERPGTFALRVSALDEILNPPSTCSLETQALVARLAAGLPAPGNWNASAIVKQLACAAAISSSGLVPFSSPKRRENE